ncbi:MAG: helix-turn-helix domain-containing protein [Acidimicrobiales bacterium]
MNHPPHTDSSPSRDHESANRLVEARHASGMTQVELARRWGRAQSQVARIERSPIESVTLRTLQSYVDALGGSCRVIVDIEGHQFEL